MHLGLRVPNKAMKIRMIAAPYPSVRCLSNSMLNDAFHRQSRLWLRQHHCTHMCHTETQANTSNILGNDVNTRTRHSLTRSLQPSCDMTGIPIGSATAPCSVDHWFCPGSCRMNMSLGVLEGPEPKAPVAVSSVLTRGDTTMTCIQVGLRWTKAA